MDFRTDQITLVLEYFSSLAQRFPEQPVGIILRKDLLEMIGKIFCMYTKACFFRIRLNVSVNQDNSLFWFIIMLVYKYYNQQFLFNNLDSITSLRLCMGSNVTEGQVVSKHFIVRKNVVIRVTKVGILAVIFYISTL